MPGSTNDGAGSGESISFGYKTRTFSEPNVIGKDVFLAYTASSLVMIYPLSEEELYLETSMPSVKDAEMPKVDGRVVSCEPVFSV